jgi:hypothetical protein
MGLKINTTTVYDDGGAAISSGSGMGATGFKNTSNVDMTQYVRYASYSDTRTGNCTGIVPSGNCLGDGYWNPPNGNWWTWGISGVSTGLCGNPSGFDFAGGAPAQYYPTAAAGLIYDAYGILYERIRGPHYNRNYYNCNCNSGYNSVGNCYYNCNCNCNCACGKIICTELYEQDMLDKATFLADQRYAVWLRDNRPYVYEGYVSWAETVVDWMRGEGPQIFFWIRDPEKQRKAIRAATIRIVKELGDPWRREMAFRVGAIPESVKAGRVIMAVGMPICGAIGWIRKVTKAEPKPKRGRIYGSVLALTFGIAWGLSKLMPKSWSK